MTSKGKDHFKYEKKWSDHFPILWKKNIHDIIKKDHLFALKTFYYNYKQGNNRKQMKYGLELLLPESLYLILSSFNSIDSQREAVAFLDLLTSADFLTQVNLLKEIDQKTILIQIQTYWHSKSLSKKRMSSLLKNLNPGLVGFLYSTLINKEKKSSLAHIIDIMRLWGTNILPNTLGHFLESPNDQISPLFREITPTKRIEIIRTYNNYKSLVITRFKNLLSLLTPTELEILLLLEIQSQLPTESKNFLIQWLIEQNISSETLIKLYQTQVEIKDYSFIIMFIIERIKKKIVDITEEIILLLTLKELDIAHRVLEELNNYKEYNSAEILPVVILTLQKKTSDFTDFFYTELKIYAPNQIKNYLLVYLKEKNYWIHQIILPVLQEYVSKEWPLILNTIVEKKTESPKHLVQNIFIKCDSKTKYRIGQYIIEKSLIPILYVLFQDYSIFMPVLLSKKEISLSEQIVLEPILKQHLLEQFTSIIMLGDKITYPKLAFASLLDKKSLKNLLDIISSSKNGIKLLSYWEEVLIACTDDIIILLLEKVANQGLDEKNILFKLLKRLIDLDINQFWSYFQRVSAKKLSNFHDILIHIFQENISNLPIILSQLSKTHFSYILDQIIPVSSQYDSNMLYSLLSIKNTVNINEGVINRTILKLISLNQEKFISPTLVRCSKSITNIDIKSLFSNITKSIIKEYPEKSLNIIDSNRLYPLTQEVQHYFSSLTINELEKLLRQIIPILQTEILSPIIINYYQRVLNIQTNLSLLNDLLLDFENNKSTKEGEKLLKELFKSLIRKSSEIDLSLFKSLQKKQHCQSLLIHDYFEQISQSTIEKIVLNPEFNLLEESVIKGLMKRFENHPPDKPEQYFFNLYQKVKNEEIKQAIIPILGKYCSWPNLPNLIMLPEKNEYKKAYNEALTIFSSRFNIQSAKALEQIWEAGLKEVYTQKNVSKYFQSQCPQCGNPILEKQQSCGFCTQNLSCIICRQSIVSLSKKDVIQCPHCDNFFHRDHLIESIRGNNKCPVCNAKINAHEILSLPNYEFFFQ